MIILIVTISVVITTRYQYARVDPKANKLRHASYPCRHLVMLIFIIFVRVLVMKILTTWRFHVSNYLSWSIT